MASVVYDYNSAGKVIANATAAVYSYGASEIAGDGVASYIVTLTGTNDDYGSIGAGHISVKAGGQPIVAVLPAHLTAFIQRMSTSKWAMAAADTGFQIPLYTLDAKGEERYACGFPNGMSPTLEIPVDGTGSAGTMTAGWRLYEGQFPFYPLLLGSALNWTASTTNNRFPITQGGLLRGFSINTTGLDRLRLVIGGKQLFNLSGPQLVQSQAMEGGDGGSTNEMFFKIDELLPITAGNSFAEGDVAAGWAGVANQITLYSYVPQETNHD
jgi:hypothetical protein